MCANMFSTRITSHCAKIMLVLIMFALLEARWNRKSELVYLSYPQINQVVTPTRHRSPLHTLPLTKEQDAAVW